jgi:hypothetical protein
MMVSILPIRHFSVRSSQEVLRLCQLEMPDCILIEAPEDLLESAISVASDPKARLPVSIIAYTQSPMRSVSLPFVDFSPEWVALQWGLSHHIEVRFFDLPTSQILLDEIQLPAKMSEPTEEMDIESLGDNYLLDMEQLGQRARETHLSATDKKREGYMLAALNLAKTQYEKIVVVCGALHAPAIRDNITEGILVSDLIGEDIEICVVPTSLSKLSTQSGYVSGSLAPGYDALRWQLRQEPSRIAPTFLSRLAQIVSETHLPISSAQVVDATLLAQSLAILRGDTMPSLEDLTLAGISIYAQGDKAQISTALERIQMGEQVGFLSVPIGQTPLQIDFRDEIQKLHLEPWIRQEETELLMRTAFDAKRSEFLNQLLVLDIPGIVSKNRGREFSVFWDASSELRLIESCVWGNTVYSATQAVLLAQLNLSTRLKQVTQIYMTAAAAGCEALFEAIEEKMEALREKETDGFSLMPILTDLSNQGRVQKRLHPYLSRLFVQVCTLLKTAKDFPPSAMESLRQLIAVFESHPFLDEDLYTSVWLSFSERSQPDISGFACSVMRQIPSLSDLSIPLLKRALSPPCTETESFLVGWLTPSRSRVLEDPVFWKTLDTWIREIPESLQLHMISVLRKLLGVFPSFDQKVIWNHVHESQRQLIPLTAENFFPDWMNVDIRLY